MIRTLIRYLATLSSLGLVVVLLGAFTETGEAGGILTERGGRQSGASLLKPVSSYHRRPWHRRYRPSPGPGAASVTHVGYAAAGGTQATADAAPSSAAR